MKWNSFLLAVGLVAAGFGVEARADAVSALARQVDLTPERLIRAFAGFTFELSEPTQDAEVFLQRKRGDCDDFAILASRLLSERGYTTKLVTVMMERQTHVVCYVEEAQGYLDFNHRTNAQPVIRSDGSLEDIAHKVAGDFHSQWQTASEFKYENQQPVYLETVFPPALILPAAPHEPRGTNAIAFSQPVALPPISGALVQTGPSSRP